MSLNSIDMKTGAERKVLPISNRATFEQLAQGETARWDRDYAHVQRPTFLVGISSSSTAHGAWRVYATLLDECKKQGLNADVRVTSSIGTHWVEPVVDVVYPRGIRISYAEIYPDRVADLVAGVKREQIVPEMALCAYGLEEFDGAQGYNVSGVKPAKELDFYGLQQRILMRNFGYINPRDIYDYVGRGGYAALIKVLFDWQPDQLIEEIKKANIRGRGGAGFNAGIKWEGARKAKGSPKYVICNAHEGEPNVFKDRRLMESDPHLLIEGLIIESWAVGSHIAYIYIGDEYPMAIRTMEHAVEQAKQLGLIGENILGSGYDLNVQVYMGGGAYISGLADALQTGIEGQRAFPRTKPPRSVESGLWGKPTCVNNVETMTNVPWIVNKGADWFLGLGTQKSPGTKLVSLMGHTRTIGVSEVPLGTTMHDLVYKIGGGVVGDENGERKFRFIQTGGTSGGMMLDEHLHLKMTFDNGPEDMGAVGGVLGSGGFVVLNDTACPVDFARYFMRFNRYESCGKCVPCRIGTKSLLDMFDRICTGLGREDDVPALKEWSDHVVTMSLCGLGQAAPLPTLSLLQNFMPDLLEHIREKQCRYGRCEALVALEQERKELGLPQRGQQNNLLKEAPMPQLAVAK